MMNTVLGIHCTCWVNFVADTLIERSGSDLSKMTFQQINTENVNNAVAKYAKKAMEIYSEITVNIVSSSHKDSNTRNEIRIKPLLVKLKRTLTLRFAKLTSWKLPTLHAVSTAKEAISPRPV